MDRYQTIIDPDTGKPDPSVIRLIRADGTISTVPDDPSNLEWQIYQAWLAAGNQPEPPSQ